MVKIKKMDVTPVRWSNRITEIARTHMLKETEDKEKDLEEKCEKKQLFLLRFLNDAKLLLYKTIGIQQSKLSRTWNSEGAKDIKGIATFVVGYGLLGVAVMLTFSDKWVLGYETILHVLGAGSGVYLFMDLFKFTVDTIRGRRR